MTFEDVDIPCQRSWGSSSGVDFSSGWAGLPSGYGTAGTAIGKSHRARASTIRPSNHVSIHIYTAPCRDQALKENHRFGGICFVWSDDDADVLMFGLLLTLRSVLQ